MNLGLLWRTTRHLKPVQIWQQLLRRLRQPRPPGLPPANLTSPLPKLADGCPRSGKHLGDHRFRFLNHEVDFGSEVDWNAAEQPMLWRYNLHYFEFLAQAELSIEDGWRLIRAWIKQHPYTKGAIGWHPYPISLRIVQWIRWMARVGETPADVLASLWQQADSLSQQIEWHILGNHLFVNGKALWFAGVVLGEEHWQRTGERIVREQTEEQFLPDGGQFELSPMYHALAVEDLLDLYNLTRDQQLSEVTCRALGWLQRIQGEQSPPLLNDAAYGVAPASDELEAYAARLDLRSDFSRIKRTEFDHGWRGRNCSGYQVIEREGVRLIFDTAKIGPDYLPGHAHCDMLSLLCDIGDQPVFADTGVHEYSESERRHYSRSTLAHNTISIDEGEQAEIWKSFRVGRRGRPIDVSCEAAGVRAGHSGFAAVRTGVYHHRRLLLSQDGFSVEDDLSGPGGHSFCGRWHLHPGLQVKSLAGGEFVLNGRLRVRISGAAVRVIETEYYPQYGIIEKRPCLEFTGRFSGTTRVVTTCTFCF